MMEIMGDSPCNFLNNCPPFGDEEAYPDSLGPDMGFDQQRLKIYDFMDEPPLLRASKSQVPRSSTWDRMESTEEGSGPGNLSLFVDPSLYSDNGTMPGLAMHGDDSPPSPVSPESPPSPSTRRPSTVKSEFPEVLKSGSSSTDMTLPDPPPPQKKRKPRKTKRANNTPKDEERRIKFLERNRIAASKCREKKKMFVSELEETKIDLEARHAQLQMEYNGLLGEVSGLKHRLMAHAKCSDSTIDRWLANEARKFVQTSHNLFGNYQGAPPHIGHTRNNSTASSGHSVSFNPLDDVGGRRDSIAFSPGSSLQASPTEMGFPPLGSPKLKTELDMNYNHMPDILLSS